MPWWLLLLELFIVWMLWAVASASGLAALNELNGVPDGERGGVSIAPAIPLFPLAFLALALLVDCVANPWGTVAIAWFHAALGFLFTACILRDWLRIRRKRRSEPTLSTKDRA